MDEKLIRAEVFREIRLRISLAREHLTFVSSSVDKIIDEVEKEYEQKDTN